MKWVYRGISLIFIRYMASPTNATSWTHVRRDLHHGSPDRPSKKGQYRTGIPRTVVGSTLSAQY